MKSTFDPKQFLTSQIQSKLSTKIIPADNDEYQGQINALNPRVTMKKDTGEVFHWLDISWELLDQKAKDKTKLDHPIGRQSLRIDLTEQGSLDFSEGKNVGLGRVREALKQNTAAPWAPAMLMGGTAFVITKQSVDENDPDIVYTNVVKVSRTSTTKVKAA